MNFSYLNNEIRFVNANVPQRNRLHDSQDDDKMWLYMWLHNKKKNKSQCTEKYCPKCNLLLPLNGLCDQCD